MSANPGSETFLEHNHRTRVLLHLPVNDSRQHRALFEIVGHLRACRERGIDGFTLSVFSPPGFVGYWWNEEESPPTLADDWIVVCVLDVPPLPRPVDELLVELEAEVHRIYCEVGTPQKEIWVSAHPIIQYSRPKTDQP